MRKRLTVLPLILGFLISLAAPAAEGPKPIVVYTAWALNMLGGGGGTNVTIGIYRWSSDAERIALTDVLRTEGNAQMVADLSQLPQVGYIYTQGTLAYALYYAYETPLPGGGKKIVMATNRPLSFGGAVSPGAQQKYDLGILEMHFDKDGKAEGKIIVQGMASIDKKTGKVEVNNYGGQPTRLLQIKEEKQ